MTNFSNHDLLVAVRRHVRARDLMKRAQNRGTSVIATRYEAAEGEHDAERQSDEQVAAYAIEEDDREEDDGGGEGGGEHGQLDFLASAFGGDHRVFAFFEVAEDVFQHDDRVIDQAREHKGESAKNHRVDGAARRRSEAGMRRGRRWEWRAAPRSCRASIPER